MKQAAINTTTTVPIPDSEGVPAPVRLGRGAAAGPGRDRGPELTGGEPYSLPHPLGARVGRSTASTRATRRGHALFAVAKLLSLDPGDVTYHHGLGALPTRRRRRHAPRAAGRAPGGARGRLRGHKGRCAGEVPGAVAGGGNAAQGPSHPPRRADSFPSAAGLRRRLRVLSAAGPATAGHPAGRRAQDPRSQTAGRG